MFNNILEISKRASKNGRIPIKIALLKIHDDTETNLNGIHWSEKYVKNNMESAKMMPICCEFTDETKSIPLGHGVTGSSFDENGIEQPEFLNSETVGVIESVYIDNVDIEGVQTKVLVGEGYIFSQRYPELVKWIRKNLALNSVLTSIEIMGLEINDNKITYLEDKPTDEFRTPVDFVFSGTAILSVQASDSNAIILEVAQKNNKEEKFDMDEKELKALIQATISESNSKNDELTTQITELNSQITEKDGAISELNASIAQLQKALADLKAEHETYWAERDLLEKELVKAKVATKLGELDSTIGEFNEAEQAFAKDDIDTLRTNIEACEKSEDLENMTSEINSIKAKICTAIVENQKKLESEKAEQIAEQNAAKANETIDIFSEISSAEDEEDEDINIF